jgi:hypothetical protein
MPHRATILAVLLLLPSVSPGDPGASVPAAAVLHEKTQLRETFTVADSEIQGYGIEKDPGPMVPREGRFGFIVRPAKKPPYVYRVCSTPVGPDRVRLAIFVVDQGPSDAGQQPPDAPRVVTKLLAPAAATYEASRELVRDCEQAAVDWEAHKAFLPEALSADAKVSHEGWRKIAADLERARARHPQHLGILKDLIVAYTRLFPFERNSARGTNLCALIPQRIAELEAAAAGPLGFYEAQTVRRARALFYFHTGLYPLARAEIDQAGNDPDLALLRQALEAIGQAEFVQLETFEVQGELAPCRVTVYATKGLPPDPQTPFHKWFFITQVKREGAATGAVWYTLGCQVLTQSPRYYLYGFAGNHQKLLRLYGRTLPAYDQVRASVQKLIRDALQK